MKITYILPPFISKHSGGYAVVYEYASQLASRGHDVTVVHHRRHRNIKFHPPFTIRPFIELYLWATGIARKFFRPTIMRKVNWYPVDSRVKIIDVPELTASYIPDGDALFNSRFAAEYTPEKGKEFFFQQGSLGYPLATEVQKRNLVLWRGVYRVVISRWMYDQGLKQGIPADEMIHIPNGIDHSKYQLIVPIENRPQRVAMLYHTMALKRSKDGIKALELARERIPSLEAVFFSTFPRPKSLPDWIEYHYNPSQEELVGSIYNGSSIYLCPSWVEGFGLPPAEAMACGCAVVSTANGGVQDFAEHETTALLSPPKDPGALAANLVHLLRDDKLRIKLAKAGHERIQEFTWECSTDLLEQVLFDKIGLPSAQEKL